MKNLNKTQYNSSCGDPLNFDEFNENTYFDDSPPPRTKIVTEGFTFIGDSEPYRQGVEIRSIKGFSTGMVRMHSGYKGHRIGTTYIGQDDDDYLSQVKPNNTFQDDETYSPLKYILSDPDSIAFVSSEGWSMYNNGQLKNVIEPLSIRPVVSFLTTYFPFEAHSFWANLQDGNLEGDRSSCLIETVTLRNNSNSATPFLDLYEDNLLALRGLGITNFNDKPLLTPFIDNDNKEELTKNLTGNITTITSGLNFSENSYVTNDYIASTSGFYYDGAIQGTDSLAFGEMTYT